MVLTIVAMPAYNEERSIAKVVLGCKRWVDKVIVVDDGSTDNTAEIAEALGAYVIRLTKNMGYGAAIRGCFSAARELGADRMVIIDADGQHDASEIPLLLKPLDNGADIVIGSRFCNGNGQGVPAYRKLGISLLNAATNVAGSINVSDTQSGFRAYGKNAIEKIQIKENDMSAGSEILLQVKDNNFKVEEVDIHCSYDVEDASTLNPISHGIQVLSDVLQKMELKKPLYYFTVPGMLFAAIGFSLGLESLRIFYHGGNLSFGPTVLMMLLTLYGSLMAFTGIILHCIIRVMKETK